MNLEILMTSNYLQDYWLLGIPREFLDETGIVFE